jgi:hypothetical protein
MKFSSGDLASFTFALSQFLNAEQLAPLLANISKAIVSFPALPVLMVWDASQLLHVLGRGFDHWLLAESDPMPCLSNSPIPDALISLFGVASREIHKASPQDFTMICGVIAAMWPFCSGSGRTKLKPEISAAIAAAHKDAMTAYRFRAHEIPWYDFVPTTVALAKCSPDDFFWDSFQTVVNQNCVGKPSSLQMQSVKNLSQLVQVYSKMPPGNCSDIRILEVLFEAAKAKLELFTARDVASFARSTSKISNPKGRELLHSLFTSAIGLASSMEALDIVELLCALGRLTGDDSSDDAWAMYKPLIYRLLRRLLSLWQRQVPKDISILSKLLWALAKLQPPQDNADISKLLCLVLPILDTGVVSRAGSRQLAKMAWSVSELLQFTDLVFAPFMPAAWKSLRAELWTRDLNTFSDRDACLSVLGVAQYIRNFAATPRYGEDEQQRTLDISEEHGEVGTSGEVFSRLTAEIESRWKASIGCQSQSQRVTSADGVMLVSAFEAVGRSVPRWVNVHNNESTSVHGQDVYQ